MPKKKKIATNKTPRSQLVQPPNEDLKAIFHTIGNIYSSHKFPAGTVTAGNKPIFSVGKNNSGQGFTAPLTDSYTNLENKDGIPYGFEMDVLAIGIEVQYKVIRLPGALVDADIIPAEKLIENMILIYKYSSVEIVKGSVPQFPCGYGGEVTIDWKQTTAADAAYYRYQNGRPTVEAIKWLPEPLKLAGKKTQLWFLKVTDQAAGDITEDLIVKVNFYGPHSDQIGDISR